MQIKNTQFYIHTDAHTRTHTDAHTHTVIHIITDTYGDHYQLSQAVLLDKIIINTRVSWLRVEVFSRVIQILLIPF